VKPEARPFLRGPISKKKTFLTFCQGCGSIQVMWSPTVTGVLVCPYCNTRLLESRSAPYKL